MENFDIIESISKADVSTLREKSKAYGDSWKKRGGVGAYMMLARKFDRLENICKRNGWDIFAAGCVDDGGIIDDIRDLRCYLLLVESEIENNKIASEPSSAYVNQ